MKNTLKGNKRSRDATLISAFLIALFFVGGELMKAGTNKAISLYEIMICAAIACVAFCVAFPAAVSIFSEKHISNIKTVGRKILLLLLAPAVLAGGGAAAVFITKEFSFFSSDVMLLRSIPTIVGLLFLLFSAYVASKGISVIKKLSLLSFVFVVLGSLVLFLMALPSLDWKSLSLNFRQGFASEISARSLIGLFCSSFAPLSVGLVLLTSDTDTYKRPSAIALPIGILLGGALLAISYLMTVLLLGANFAATLKYPYSTAIGTISAGKLFIRVEGVSYFIYFLSTVIRASVSISAVTEVLAKLLPKNIKKDRIAFFTAAVIFIVFAISIKTAG